MVIRGIERGRIVQDEQDRNHFVSRLGNFAQEAETLIYTCIVTNIAVINVSEAGLVLEEVAPGWTVEEVQALTEPKLIVAKDIKEMQL